MDMVPTRFSNFLSNDAKLRDDILCTMLTGELRIYSAVGILFRAGFFLVSALNILSPPRLLERNCFFAGLESGVELLLHVWQFTIKLPP